MPEAPFKKYILFRFTWHYPAGGLGDIAGSFDSIDEAKAFNESEGAVDTSEIVDRDTWKVVWSD